MTKISVGLCVLLLGASCGGGVSREDFVAEADPICARVTSAVKEIPEPQSAEEIVPFLEETIPLVEDGLDDLRDVEPPEEDQDTFDEWIDILEQQNDKAEEALAAAQAGDQATFEAAFAELDELNAEGNDLAADLGLDDCAEED